MALFPGPVSADEILPPAAFAVVMIDDKTEAALGAFPYERGVYARGVEGLAAAGARGVVLKFFIDRPKTAEGDAALAASLRKVKVILQARIDDSEARPNALPDRFVMTGVGDGGRDARPPSGESGWLPLAALAANAHDLGFLDSTPSVELVPVVEQYRGKYVKSLYTAALELALGERAKVEPGRWMQIGERRVETDARCLAPVSLPARDGLRTHSFVELINGKIPAGELKDRVVIVGYDGARMETNKTRIGMVKGHRLFCYQLFSLYRALTRKE